MSIVNWVNFCREGLHWLWLSNDWLHRWVFFNIFWCQKFILKRRFKNWPATVTCAPTCTRLVSPRGSAGISSSSRWRLGVVAEGIVSGTGSFSADWGGNFTQLHIHGRRPSNSVGTDGTAAPVRGGWFKCYRIFADDCLCILCTKFDQLSCTPLFNVSPIQVKCRNIVPSKVSA